MGSVDAAKFDTTAVWQALQSCKKSGDWARAIAVVADLPPLSGRSRIKSLGFCASICAKTSQWQAALQLLADAGGNDVVLGSSVVTACGKAEEWSQALRAVEDSLGRRLRADTTFYNAAISACSKRWPWSLEMLGRMNKAHVELDTFTMNSVLSAVTRAANGWKMALQLMEEMESMQVPADIISFNTLLNADAGWPMALALLAALQLRKLKVETLTFNTAISACEASWTHALDLLRQMRLKQLQLDGITFGSVINACGKAGQWQLAVAILEESLAEGAASAVAFHSAVYACDLCGRWNVAMELMEKLMAAEFPDAMVERVRYIRKYAHRYLAGGPEDCLKHITLVALLEHMVQDSRPFSYVDAHAGGGLYDLRSEEAQVFCNFQDGIGQLLADCSGPGALGKLQRCVARWNKPWAELRYYLGSPILALQFLRRQDEAHLFEDSRPVAMDLRKSVAQVTNNCQPRVNVLEDGVDVGHGGRGVMITGMMIQFAGLLLEVLI